MPHPALEIMAEPNIDNEELAVFLDLVQCRNHRKLKSLRRKSDRDNWINNMVLRRYSDHYTVLMLMFKRSLQPDSGTRPKKITQCQSIKTLKVLFKHLVDREKRWLIMDMKDPDYNLCILNELAETGHYCVVRYLLSMLSVSERQHVVVDNSPGMEFPNSLLRIAGRESHMYKVLKKLHAIPTQRTDLTTNPPYRPGVCPTTGYIGVALVVNISFKEDGALQHMRIGGDSYSDNISQALARLNFRVDTLSEIATKEEIFTRVDTLKTDMVGSVFCLVIQTHGILGNMALSNTTLETDKLMQRIQDSLPTDTKKLAFLQHCRVEVPSTQNGQGADNVIAFRGRLPGNNWLIGYACGYGRTASRHTYIKQLAETLNEITTSRYLIRDVLGQVHAQIKTTTADQNPEYLTNLSCDICLSALSHNTQL